MSSPINITEAQLAANRENSRQSTGPRTEEGKQRTRLNGLRHGLTGQTIVMPHEDQQAWERFSAGILTSLRAETDLERNLAQAIAADQWRLNRARAIEENIFSLGLVTNPIEADDTDPRILAALTQARTFLDDSKQLALLTVYESRINRNLQRNMNELTRLQALREQARRDALDQALLLAQLAVSRGETPVPDPPAAPHGFAFSSSEITFHLDRNARLAAARQLFPRAAAQSASRHPNSLLY